MQIETIALSGFPDQRPGTSGLRKTVAHFQQPHYVENFIQSLFDVAVVNPQAPLILGGDGRFYNAQVIQRILRMAAANGFAHIIVGREGLLSTPAVSHLIRKRRATGGIILSASHNPGGPKGDFGIKYNGANGGPAPEKLTEAIYARAKQNKTTKILVASDLDLSKTGQYWLGQTRVEIIDPVCDYADFMEELFDFEAIRQAIARGLRFQFDAMHAVTGPYAKEIFETRLGFPAGTVKNAIPLEDFGGQHPDPNLMHAQDLYHSMFKDNAPDLGAASDGDGDRNLIIGRKQFVNPADSLAIMLAHASSIKGYKHGVRGVARSMPTSQAVDCVAKHLNLPVYETPTGWKFFGNLLEAGKITFCGEESFGTGADHIREKDGLWAILYWLNLLAVTGKSVKEIVCAHWKKFGRFYALRYDYEGLDAEQAQRFLDRLRSELAELVGQHFGDLKLEQADEFSYCDPVDGSVSLRQGFRFFFSGQHRLVLRLSGTGTCGATLRLYLEHYETKEGQHLLTPQQGVRMLANALEPLLQIKAHFGREKPTIVT